MGQTKGSNLFLGIIAGLGLLLGAAFAGGVAANQLLDGCGTIEVVTFSPQPPGLESKHTYWLVLHQGSVYYLRDQNATDGIHIFESEPGLIAHVTKQAQKGSC